MVDHFQIDVRFSKCGTRFRHSTDGIDHAFADDHQEAYAAFYVHIVRFQFVLQAVKQLLFLLHRHLIGAQDNRQIVDTGWHVFEVQVEIFEYLQHSASESDFAVHQVFADVDAHESSRAGNTGNNLLVFRLRSRDAGPWSRRIVGVFDDNRDSGTESRLQSFVMENRKSTVG